MSDHDETYGRQRQERLITLLRDLADRIRQLDGNGELLAKVPELIRLMGEARSELFHYEVRSTYDTPEVAESRRIVEEAGRQGKFRIDDQPEDDVPWRKPGEE